MNEDVIKTYSQGRACRYKYWLDEKMTKLSDNYENGFFIGYNLESLSAVIESDIMTHRIAPIVHLEFTE